MNNIVFVVLHYETLDDTKKCVDSLLKYLKHPGVELVLVDNGSKNGKLEAIMPNYAGQERIHYLRSEKNLGFANGNNLGFEFAKSQLHADLIILANNDLVFRQEDFIDTLENAYSDTAFDVAGPRIISMVDGKNQNPVCVQYHNLRDVNKRIFKDSILSFLCNFNLDRYVQKFFAKEIPQVAYQPGMDFQLHGACMIFANRYLERYDGLCDKTFMYGEENILKYMIVRDCMNMVYLDALTVYHKEGSSTGAIYGKGREKRKFYYKWNLHSCKQLKRMMLAKNDKV